MKKNYKPLDRQRSKSFVFNYDQMGVDEYWETANHELESESISLDFSEGSNSEKKAYKKSFDKEYTQNFYNNVDISGIDESVFEEKAKKEEKVSKPKVTLNEVLSEEIEEQEEEIEEQEEEIEEQEEEIEEVSQNSISDQEICINTSETSTHKTEEHKTTSEESEMTINIAKKRRTTALKEENSFLSDAYKHKSTTKAFKKENLKKIFIPASGEAIGIVDIRKASSEKSFYKKLFCFENIESGVLFLKHKSSIQSEKACQNMLISVVKGRARLVVDDSTLLVSTGAFLSILCGSIYSVAALNLGGVVLNVTFFI